MTDRRSTLAFLLLAPLLPAAAALAAPRRPDDDDDTTRGIPNMFISPCGEPFRAADGAPYPVVDWFKQADANGDDKVDRAEFRADADRFFKKLDLNGDGALTRPEILAYERKWVPEILGGTVGVGFNDTTPRLWLAQYGPSGGMGGGMGGRTPSINPQGDKPMATPKAPEGLNETGVLQLLRRARADHDRRPRRQRHHPARQFPQGRGHALRRPGSRRAGLSDPEGPAPDHGREVAQPEPPSEVEPVGPQHPLARTSRVGPPTRKAA